MKRFVNRAGLVLVNWSEWWMVRPDEGFRRFGMAITKYVYANTWKSEKKASAEPDFSGFLEKVDNDPQKVTILEAVANPVALLCCRTRQYSSSLPVILVKPIFNLLKRALILNL